MKKTISVVLLSAFLSTNALAKEQTALFNDHAKLFINEFAEEGTYSSEELRRIFSQVKIQMKAKKESKNQAEFKLEWTTYKNRMVTNERIKKGKEFLKENKEIFDIVEKKYDVEREVIAAIIGIESNYGKNMGNYKAINALSTMAFEYYNKNNFYRNQLKSFLNRCKKENTDCFKPQSSWAGAMGYGQFIPTSIDGYAVDFNKNGKVDVINETEDAIASVANYLKKHGWKKGDLIAKQVTVEDPRHRKALTSKLKLNTTVQELRFLNVKDIGNVKGTKKAKLYEMTDKWKRYTWVGYNNFKAITHYNRSNFYATSVYLLSQELK